MQNIYAVTVSRVWAYWFLVLHVELRVGGRRNKNPSYMHENPAITATPMRALKTLEF